LEYPKSDYKEYPKTLPRDDLWGQVRRTIHGRRISEAEVAAIVASIVHGLQLAAGDTLLDLACGNGALTARLFSSCRKVLGIDFSPYLVDVAKEFFERVPEYVFIEAEMLTYVRTEPDPLPFTKAMCYASIQYLPVASVELILAELNRRFRNVTRILLGNVPDKDRAELFFGGERPRVAELSDPTSQIGVWWNQSELRDVAERCGWSISFSRLPENVFNARYRYDAILTRGSPRASEG
jgi:cyclopropane fatty-acyl-phospholipid synthase-like methyltransferase